MNFSLSLFSLLNPSIYISILFHYSLIQQSEKNNNNFSYTVTGEELSSSRSWWRLSDERAGVTSPAARDGRGRIDVDAEIGTGVIQIEESSSQTRWSGSTETSTWVVDSWTDDNGYHDELLVAGMTHPAVSSDTADSCLDQVLDNNDDNDDDDNDGDDDRPWASWRDLSELSGRQRSAYEGCLTTAWEKML